MADEQSKNNYIKLIKGRVQKISIDEILEVIGKAKTFKRSYQQQKRTSFWEIYNISTK